MRLGPTQRAGIRWANESGAVASLQSRVLHLLHVEPNLTVNEIAQRLGRHPSDITGRIADLRKDGLIRLIGTRPSEVTGVENKAYAAVGAPTARGRQSALESWFG